MGCKQSRVPLLEDRDRGDVQHLKEQIASAEEECRQTRYKLSGEQANLASLRSEHEERVALLKRENARLAEENQRLAAEAFKLRDLVSGPSREQFWLCSKALESVRDAWLEMREQDPVATVQLLQPVPLRFLAWDADRDGLLSRTEVLQHKDELRLDSDERIDAFLSDGMVDFTGFLALCVSLAYEKVMGWSRRIEAPTRQLSSLLDAQQGGSKRPQTFLQEHYARLPEVEQFKIGPIILGTGLLARILKAMEIFMLARASVAYDLAADVVVTLKIDHKDKWWIGVSIGLIVLPVAAKWALFSKVCLRQLEARWGLQPRSAKAVYGAFGFLFFLLIDFYFFLLYPWVSPSDAALFGTIERLSPIIDLCLETAGQAGFQLYMYERSQALDRKVSGSFETILLASILPAMLGLALKLYSLCKDAAGMNMTLFSYLPELIRGPLGYSAPFVHLLTQRAELSYCDLGPMNERQQSQIYSAIGSENKVLKSISFDDLNGMKLQRLAEAISENETLEYLGLGRGYSVEDAASFLAALHEREEGAGEREEAAAPAEGQEDLEAAALNEGKAFGGSVGFRREDGRGGVDLNAREQRRWAKDAVEILNQARRALESERPHDVTWSLVFLMAMRSHLCLKMEAPQEERLRLLNFSEVAGAATSRTEMAMACSHGELIGLTGEVVEARVEELAQWRDAEEMQARSVPSKNFWLWGQWRNRHIATPFATEKVPWRVHKALIGDSFIIVLLEHGRVMSWGEDKDGCLGLGLEEEGLPGPDEENKERRAKSSPNPTRLSFFDGSSRIVDLQLGGPPQSHVLALSSNGIVYSWGCNDYGQLGVESTQPAFKPGQVKGLEDVTVIQIVALKGMSYALSSRGVVYGWGHNEQGCLPLEHDRLRVLKPEPLLRISQSASVRKLLVKMNYPVNGSDAPGKSDILIGLTGTEESGGHASPSQAVCNFWLWGTWGKRSINEPFLTQKVAKAVQDVVVMTSAIIVLDVDGVLWSWGACRDGCLGHGRESTSKPEAMPIGFPDEHDGSHMVDVQGGHKHVLVLTSSGKVYAWGSNSARQLGLESAEHSVYRPSLVEKIGAQGSVVQILAVDNRSYAVDAAGKVYMWGLGMSESGVQTLPDAELPVQRLSCEHHGKLMLGIIDWAGPVPTKFLPGGPHPLLDKHQRRAAALDHELDGSAGESHPLWDAVAARHPRWTAAAQRQLLIQQSQQRQRGRADARQILDEAALVAESAKAASEFDVSRNARPNFFLWGRWGHRKIKEPFLTKKLPGRVEKIFLFETSIVALIEGDRVASWGRASNGVLGHGRDLLNTDKARRVVMGKVETKVLDVQAGPNYVLALTEEGKVYAWGENEEGQLGLGDQEPRFWPTPVPIKNEVRNHLVVTQVLTFRKESFAVTRDGRVFAWGGSEYGSKPSSILKDHSGGPSVQKLLLRQTVGGGPGDRAIVALLKPEEPQAKGGEAEEGAGQSQPAPGGGAVPSAEAASESPAISFLVWGVWNGHTVQRPCRMVRLLLDGSVDAQAVQLQDVVLARQSVTVLTEDGRLLSWEVHTDWWNNFTGEALPEGSQHESPGVEDVPPGSQQESPEAQRLSAGLRMRVSALATQSRYRHILRGARTLEGCRQLPLPDGTGARVSELQAGSSHFLALTNKGKVLAWGGNDKDQLGLQSWSDDTPSAVPIFDKFMNSEMEVVQVLAHEDQSYALCKGGSIYAWGAVAAAFGVEVQEKSEPREMPLVSQHPVHKITADAGSIVAFLAGESEEP